MIRDKIKEWYGIDDYSFDTVMESDYLLSEKFKELENLNLLINLKF